MRTLALVTDGYLGGCPLSIVTSGYLYCPSVTVFFGIDSLLSDNLATIGYIQTSNAAVSLFNTAEIFTMIYLNNEGLDSPIDKDSPVTSTIKKSRGITALINPEIF